MTWPSTITALTNPQPTDKLNSPSHSSIHTAANTEITQIETFIGTESSAVGTILYDVRSPLSDGGGHVQTAIKGGTGQISYTKGDVLVAINSSTLSKLAAGQDGNYLKSNSSVAAGIQWAPFPGTPIITSYMTASTLTWLKPSVFSYIVVEALGGGAGGNNTGSKTGGNSGAYGRKIISASTLQLTETVVIGKAGAQASVGGFSSFGTTPYLVADGGGFNNNTVNASTFGADFSISGNPGGDLATLSGAGGNGGNAPLGFGYGGVSSIFGGKGKNAVGFGAAGAGYDDGAGGARGGSGTAGLIIITQY